jgi:hypothetical protein
MNLSLNNHCLTTINDNILYDYIYNRSHGVIDYDDNNYIMIN